MHSRNAFTTLEVDGVAKVDPLPDGKYFCLAALVAEDSDFTLDEAVARLQAALPGRVVLAFPTRRNRAALAPWGGKQFVGFYIEAAAETAGGLPPALEGTDAPAPDGCPAVLRRAWKFCPGSRECG